MADLSETRGTCDGEVERGVLEHVRICRTGLTIIGLRIVQIAIQCETAWAGRDPQPLHLARHGEWRGRSSTCHRLLYPHAAWYNWCAACAPDQGNGLEVFPDDTVITIEFHLLRPSTFGAPWAVLAWAQRVEPIFSRCALNTLSGATARTNPTGVQLKHPVFWTNHVVPLCYMDRERWERLHYDAGRGTGRISTLKVDTRGRLRLVERQQ